MSSKDLFCIDQKLGVAGGSPYSDADFEKLDKRHSQLASSSSGDGGSTAEIRRAVATALFAGTAEAAAASAAWAVVVVAVSFATSIG